MFQHALLDEFGALVGIENLRFDEQGLCSFFVDGRTPLSIAMANERWVLSLQLEALPDLAYRPAMDVIKRAPELTQEAMSGAAPLLTWHPDLCLPIALRTLPEHGTTARAVADAVAGLIEFSTHCQRQLSC